MADYIDAHKYCIKNKDALLNDEKCGCFYCLSVFSTSEITEWLKEGCGTALCPRCGIDSVIGEGSGYPITEEFLKKMHDYWFSESTEPSSQKTEE